MLVEGGSSKRHSWQNDACISDCFLVGGARSCQHCSFSWHWIFLETVVAHA